MKIRRPTSTRIILLSLLLGFFGTASAVQGQDSSPRLLPNQAALEYASKGTSDWRSALQLGLWASSVSPGAPTQATGGAAPGGSSREQAYTAAVEAAVADLLQKTSGMDDRAKGEAVLQYMHKRFLVAYSERQTRLDVVFDRGTFNCVSSAVLYLVLAEAVGLRVSGVETTDHAFCSVSVGSELVDVETTSPYGFDPGGKKEFHDSFGRVTGFAYVPQRNYRDRSSISGTALVSLILSNRIADLDAAGRYADSVGLGVDRWALLGGNSGGSAADRDQLLIRLTNYGALLVKAGLEERALRWSAAAIAAYGDDPRWSDFVAAAANNLLVRDLRAGRVSQARADLERLRPSLGPGAARDLDSLVSDAELVALAEGRDPAALTAALAAQRGAKVLPEKRLREIEIYARMLDLDRISRAEGWAAAYAASQAALSDLGSDPQLEAARRTFRANRIAELHNAIARLYNSGAYAEAKASALAASAEFPEEGRFKTLADAAERAGASRSP